jgi:radical SAM superfamily enzyme YgiQ (UPF0313 family)
VTDVVLVTLPKMEIRAPLIGPAALKAVCEQEGYSVKCIDFNIELYHKLRTVVPEWWIYNDQTFMQDDLFEEAWNTHLEPCVHDWCLQIKELDPKVIGVTVLSMWTERICNKFLETLEEYCPDTKVVLGGPGTQPVYGQKMLDAKKIDAYFTGEGELSFREYLRGNRYYPGINGNPAVQIGDMNSLPFPDYSDFDMSKYSNTWWEPHKEPTGCKWLYITGTRGCIKRCAFCNVGSIWPKFVSKTGTTIAKEIKHYMDTTGVTHYYFTDSLLNGNVENLEEMVDAIIDLGIKPTIKGQWIARSQKLIGDELWNKMRKAGFKHLLIGIESGCAKTRNEMKKGVREEDIEYTFEQASKHKIRCIPLLMVGYPTETDEDFQENLAFWSRYKKYNDNGTILKPSVMATNILPDTPLHDKYINSGLEYDEFGHWVYGDNTMKVRIERWFKYRDEAHRLGYSLTLDTPNHLIREYKRITGIDLHEEYKLKDSEEIWND